MSGYVALDGPDGCGKSTHAAALVAWLETEGQSALHVREPGSTPVGEALRALLLAKETGELLPLTEVLLFSAARAELVRRVVEPALARGAVVVAERCFVSTSVYQILAERTALAQGLDEPWFDELTRRVHGPCLPDPIVVLDVPPDVSAQRRGRRVDDRIEARGPEFHARVRDGYLRAAAREPRAIVVDASRGFDAVQEELRRIVVERCR